jgi:superfamily II DNA or RNA helicase
MQAMSELGVEAILRSYPQRYLERGRAYVAEGRVTDLAEDVHGVSAVVTGDERYRVRIDRVTQGRPVARCTCPAWDETTRCKHIAAVVFTLSARYGARRGGLPGESSAPLEPLPASLRAVFSAATFFARLALYTQEPFTEAVEPYVPLKSWWPISGEDRELRRRLLDWTPEIEATLAQLRSFTPAGLASSSGGFSQFYEKLATIYRERRKQLQIGGALPGPLDARHPGFACAYHAKRRVFEIVERPSPLLKTPLRLAIALPLGEAPERIAFENGAFPEWGACDAWDVFALRALLEALHARADPAVQELERELDRPVWEHLLEHLAAQQGKANEPREWTFCIEHYSAGRIYTLSAYARTVGKKGQVRYKRQSFEAILAEAVLLPVEHEIARCALFSVERGGDRGALFTIGTAHGHEVLRLLARHPRVLLAERYAKAEPQTDKPASIRAGVLGMSLDSNRSRALEPRFHVDGESLKVDIAELSGERSSLFRAGTVEGGFVSIEIPPALRPWLELSSQLGRALAFPPEAVSKLASATQPLIAAGVVELPRAALGEELSYQPEPALRVEWRAEGSEVNAVVEVMIRVHPRAPFVATGGGPKLFTFEAEGVRSFVERDMTREFQIAGDALEAIDAPLVWDSGVGRTDTLHDAIDVARWLERNPLGLPIEAKVGRAPAVHQLSQKGNLVARKIGAWLRIDGSFDVGGLKVTLGEMLEAARHAQRYLRVGSGVFLDLSNEAMSKLKTLAAAAQLAPPSRVPAEARDETSAVLHDGFGALLAQVSELFESVETKGFDLREYAERFERSRNAEIPVPSLEHGKLRDYQHDGVAWMLRLASWAPGCVLADDMGLGKTVQTAAVLKARADLGPALVVAPASVSSNWVSELGRFMPSLRVRWFNEQRQAGLSGLAAGDVIVVSYGLLLRESAAFREPHWATVVVDEAQYVKNVDAQRSDAVRNLPRDFTVALTGTPLENHLGELFSIVDIAFPGLLGDEPRFRELFRRPIEVHRDADRLAALGRLVGPFLLRRTRASVLQELPPREEIIEHIDLSEPERRRYLALRNAVQKALDKQDRGTPSQLRIALLAALTRLRQMACAVRLVDPEYKGPSTKIARVVELVQQIVAEDNRVLVFSQFTEFLEMVRIALLDEGLSVASLTGETPTTHRRAIIEDFQEGHYQVFCISLLAGGTGLNLTRASYVIHLDPWWNPAVEEQATARAHRMGQTNPVTVYRMVARGTIEEAVLEMHADKRDLASAILEGKASPKQVSSAELLELLRYGG